MEDVLLTVETSSDLTSWTDAGTDLVFLESTSNADGTVTRLVRYNTPISGDATRYFRLRIELQ